MKPKSKRIAIALVSALLIMSMAIFYFQTQFGNGAKNTTRIACVGDSITCDTKYTQFLGAMLGDNFTVGNFGVGRTTVSLDFNKPYLRQPAYQNALNFDPDIVIIMLGTNDAYLSDGQRSNFIDDYSRLITPFQDLPSNPQIYLVLPPPAFDNNMGLPPSILENNVIPLINQTATNLNLPLIDAHTPLVDHPEAFTDGVHPNDEGAETIASQIYEAIT